MHLSFPARSFFWQERDDSCYVRPYTTTFYIFWSTICFGGQSQTVAEKKGNYFSKQLKISRHLYLKHLDFWFYAKNIEANLISDIFCLVNKTNTIFGQKVAQ